MYLREVTRTYELLNRSSLSVTVNIFVLIELSNTLLIFQRHAPSLTASAYVLAAVSYSVR